MYEQTDRETRQPKPLSLSWQGFTLAELLISLAILGVIATFTIPKILVAQQNRQYSESAKSVAATVSALFMNDYNTNGGESWINSHATSTYTLSLVVPSKLNHVKELTGSEIMTPPPGGSGIVYAGLSTCGVVGWLRCYQMHQGGVLWMTHLQTIYNNEYINTFYYDPDGTGPLESVGFNLSVSSRPKNCDAAGSFMPGRVVSFATSPPSFATACFNFRGYGTADPSWFSWK